MSAPNLKGLDLHSEEVQELMGAVPSWIQRWGITLIALILIGALALCATIRLPEPILNKYRQNHYFFDKKWRS